MPRLSRRLILDLAYARSEVSRLLSLGINLDLSESTHATKTGHLRQGRVQKDGKPQPRNAHEKDDADGLVKGQSSGKSATAATDAEEYGTFLVLSVFMKDVAKELPRRTWEAISGYHVDHLDKVAAKSSWSARATLMKNLVSTIVA